MNSVLSLFASHRSRTGVRVSNRRPPGAFGRKRGLTLSAAIRFALVRVYRALLEARMRHIKMELALHGVSCDRPRVSQRSRDIEAMKKSS